MLLGNWMEIKAMYSIIMQSTRVIEQVYCISAHAQIHRETLVAKIHDLKGFTLVGLTLANKISVQNICKRIH